MAKDNFLFPLDYAARNARAVQQAIDQIQSPEYLQRVSEMLADPDPTSRQAKRAKQLEDNCGVLDLQALHRHVRDNNKRLEQEGIIPRTIGTLEDLPENSLLLANAICPQCSNSKTTWCGQEHSFTYWFCAFCGHSETQRAKS